MSSHRFSSWSRAWMLAALLLGVSGVASAADGPPVRAGTITNSPPMISYASDGTTLQGVIVDLATALGKQMGRPIVLMPIPFSGLLPAMEAKRIDITFTLMNDTPEREKRIDFVDFFNLGTKLLVKKGNPQLVTDPLSLCGKTVSTVQGSTQVQLVNDWNTQCSAHGKPAINNLQYAQPSDARLQVQTGHVAAFLGNSPVMVYLAKTAGDGKVFDVVAGQEYQHVPLGIGIAKSDTALRDALQKALGTLMENGTYLAILKKYGVEGGALSTPAINGGHDLKM